MPFAPRARFLPVFPLIFLTAACLPSGLPPADPTPEGGAATTSAALVEPAAAAAATATTSSSAPAVEPPATASPRPTLAPVVPPKDTVEIVFEQHELKKQFSVYAPAGAVVKRGNLTEDVISVGDQTLFAVGAAADLMKLRKRDIADLEGRGRGKLIAEDDNGVLWSEKEGKVTSYHVMWNIDPGGGKRNACYTVKPQKKQTDVERILEMCRTLRSKP